MTSLGGSLWVPNASFFRKKQQSSFQCPHCFSSLLCWPSKYLYPNRWALYISLVYWVSYLLSLQKMLHIPVYSSHCGILDLMNLSYLDQIRSPPANDVYSILLPVFILDGARLMLFQMIECKSKPVICPQHVFFHLDNCSLLW